MAENDAGEPSHWLGFSLGLEAELYHSQCSAKASLQSLAHLRARAGRLGCKPSPTRGCWNKGEAVRLQLRKIIKKNANRLVRAVFFFLNLVLNDTNPPVLQKKKK